MRSIACLVLMLVAGCTVPASTKPDMEAPRDGPKVTTIAFEVTGARVATVLYSSNNPNGGDVHVAPNATAAIMEARWTCPADQACDLRLALFASGETSAKYSEGIGGEGRLEIQAPAAGTWNAQVQPDGAARAIGAIRVTAFYGEVPAGYTAFAS